jgi:hypothetical protein
MKPEVVIQRYPLEHVLANDKILFNVNNLGPRPDDYDVVLQKGETRNWIDHFHTPESYHTLVLDNKDLKWLREAFTIGSQTGSFPSLYQEELADTVAKYKHCFPPGSWFVRTERVSLKEGKHGKGPYSNIKCVLESMVSTRPGHSCFSPSDTQCKIYFLPWLTLDGDKEFRIFVYNNAITGISIQHLYSLNDFLSNKTDAEIVDLVYMILDFFKENIKEKLSFMRSYTMDLVILESGTPYFIETNSFGAGYAAGSALFHWETDHDQLCSEREDVVEFRMVIE